jgi:putative flippase GtrA
VRVGGLLVRFGNLLALDSGAGLSLGAAPASATATATPLNFLGNKLWSFRE